MTFPLPQLSFKIEPQRRGRERSEKRVDTPDKPCDGLAASVKTLQAPGLRKPLDQINLNKSAPFSCLNEAIALH